MVVVFWRVARCRGVPAYSEAAPTSPLTAAPSIISTIRSPRPFSPSFPFTSNSPNRFNNLAFEVDNRVLHCSRRLMSSLRRTAASRDFQSVDGLELATVEEMAASLWRIRRAWAIETRMLDNHTAAQPEGDLLDRITAAFTEPNHALGQALMHRYETRLHLMYQRAFHNLLILRQEIPNSRIPNEPNPISGHPALLESPEAGQ